MMMRPLGCLLLFVLGLGLVACTEARNKPIALTPPNHNGDMDGGDEAGQVSPLQDGGAEASKGDAGDARIADNDGATHDGGAGGGGGEDGGEAGNGGESGTADAGIVEPTCEPGAVPIPQTFTVPEAGGRFEFCTTHGTMVRFDFPASTAGLEVTATSVDPQTYAWQNAGFADAIGEAIDIQPPTSFSEPVQVRLPFDALLAFVFGTPDNVPIPLERSTADNTLLLDRFGLLGIVDPDHSCETDDGATYANGFSDEQSSGYCSGFGPKSTFRFYACPRNPFCHVITLGCCVYPEDTRTTCTTQDATVFSRFRRANPTAEHSYCDGVGSTPYVQSVAPVSLISNYQDQTITLTGNNFEPGGYVIGGSGGIVVIPFILESMTLSSTTVVATVSGIALDVPEGAINVGYENPWTSGLESDWHRSSNLFVVPLSAPDVVCPIPGQGDPPVGQCSSTINGCECSAIFDPGDGLHEYVLSCDGSSCACTRDDVTMASTTQQVAGVCSDEFYMLRQWKHLCLHTPGFCP